MTEVNETSVVKIDSKEQRLADVREAWPVYADRLTNIVNNKPITGFVMAAFEDDSQSMVHGGMAGSPAAISRALANAAGNLIKDADTHFEPAVALMVMGRITDAMMKAYDDLGDHVSEDVRGAVQTLSATLMAAFDAEYAKSRAADSDDNGE